MLELLCTVAGREAKPPNDGARSAAALGVSQQALPAGASANDTLAKALAGVGAAGSLARIRQQSATIAAAGPAAADWQTRLTKIDGKRQRVGY